MLAWPPRGLAATISKHYEVRDLKVPGDRKLGQRFTLLVPKHTTAKVRLLVALHGLGETGDQRTGAHAWLERYGLGSAYDRLREPPIKPLSSRSRYWKPARLAALNSSLKTQPLAGLAIACPYTPNVHKAPNRSRALDKYASWIVDEVLPRARREANVFSDAAHTSLDGCSLGGYVGIEVFLRKPSHFGSWGSVQGALGLHRVGSYAKRMRAVIDKHGPRNIHLETSSTDVFRKANERFSKELSKLSIAHTLTMPPGPHNQPFLRDSGTIEMLLWHDRLPR